jgi:hypothetical protein
VVGLTRKWRSGVLLVALSQSGEGKSERMGARLGAPRGGDSEGGGGFWAVTLSVEGARCW